MTERRANHAAVVEPIECRGEAGGERGSEPGCGAHTLRHFHDRLLAAYGPQKWWPAETPLEVIVGAYLTQNTSWRSVEHSIANLKGRGVMNLEGLRTISQEELRLLIRPSGYMIRKAAAIQGFVAFLDREHESSLAALGAQPTAAVREQLLSLPGVGNETADAILLYALGHPVLVVDEYLRRVSSRHDLVPLGLKYAELQQFAAGAFSADSPASRLALYNEFHALVVEVGKRHCGVRPRCDGCPLSSDAPAVPAMHVARAEG